MPEGLSKPLSEEERRAFDAAAESVTDEDRAIMAANQPIVQEAVAAMLQNASEVTDQTDPFVVQCNKAAGDAAELYGLNRDQFCQTVVGIGISDWLSREGFDEDV